MAEVCDWTGVNRLQVQGETVGRCSGMDCEGRALSGGSIVFSRSLRMTLKSQTFTKRDRYCGPL